MKSMTLKLFVALAATGLWAAASSPARAQQRQFFVNGNRFGAWSRVNIFAMPIFQMSTDPRGANFGFSQRVLFAPAFRGSFSPFGQTAVFRSDSSASLVFNPVFGPVARVNTPALVGFTFSPVNGLRQFALPSVSVLSDRTGSIAAFNPVAPTFLAGNFNFTIPANGQFAFPLTGSSTMSLAATMRPPIPINGGTSADGFLILAAQRSALGAGARGLGNGRLPIPIHGGTSWDGFLILGAGRDLALATAAGTDAKGALLAMMLTLTQSAGSANTRPLQEQARDYSGYVPPAFIMR